MKKFLHGRHDVSLNSANLLHYKVLTILKSILVISGLCIKRRSNPRIRTTNIIIIIFIYCNWVVTRWQWLCYMYTKH